MAAHPTAPPHSVARPRARARGAWDWECRAGRFHGSHLQSALARHAREAPKIRTKLLRFFDFGPRKQVTTGQQRWIGNDFRHQRGSSGS